MAHNENTHVKILIDILIFIASSIFICFIYGGEGLKN